MIYTWGGVGKAGRQRTKDPGETYPRGKRKLQIVGAEGIVVKRKADAVVQQIGLAEEILGCTQPQPEQLQPYTPHVSQSRYINHYPRR